MSKGERIIKLEKWIKVIENGLVSETLSMVNMAKAFRKILDKHTGRLNRQGKDIFILWGRVERLEKEQNKKGFSWHNANAIENEMLKLYSSGIKKETREELRTSHPERWADRIRLEERRKFLEKIKKTRRSFNNKRYFWNLMDDDNPMEVRNEKIEKERKRGAFTALDNLINLINKQ